MAKVKPRLGPSEETIKLETKRLMINVVKYRRELLNCPTDIGSAVEAYKMAVLPAAWVMPKVTLISKNSLLCTSACLLEHSGSKHKASDDIGALLDVCCRQ
eukprot:2298613-Amphidinium_carterae.1